MFCYSVIKVLELGMRRCGIVCLEHFFEDASCADNDAYNYVTIRKLLDFMDIRFEAKSAYRICH
jgi:hypothetical protein